TLSTDIDSSSMRCAVLTFDAWSVLQTLSHTNSRGRGLARACLPLVTGTDLPITVLPITVLHSSDDILRMTAQLGPQKSESSPNGSLLLGSAHRSVLLSIPGIHHFLDVQQSRGTIKLSVSRSSHTPRLKP
ncbi:unnamed protein product, partial [Mycena citricolor]